MNLFLNKIRFKNINITHYGSLDISSTVRLAKKNHLNKLKINYVIQFHRIFIIYAYSFYTVLVCIQKFENSKYLNIAFKLYLLRLVGLAVFITYTTKYYGRLHYRFTVKEN